MTRQRSADRRQHPGGAGPYRPHGVALVAAGVLALAGLAWQLTETTWGAWAAVVRPGPARPEDAIALLAGASALAVAAWLALAVLLSGLTAVLPASVPLVGSAARAMAPRLVRQIGRAHV